MTDLAAEEVAASFDSATVLHAALSAALRGAPFRDLGHGRLAAAGVRVGGRLPWPLLRRLYARIGASEGIDPARLTMRSGLTLAESVDPAMLAACLDEGYLEWGETGRLVATEEGRMRLDAMLPVLLR